MGMGVAFLVIIANIAISTPPSVIRTAIDLTSKQQRQRTSPIRRGRLSCIEPSGGRIHRISATFHGDDSASSTPGKHRKDVLVVDFDTDAATNGSVNLDVVPVVTWKDYLFIEQERKPPHLGVIPCSSTNSHVTLDPLKSVAMGPSKGTCGVLGTVEISQVNTSFTITQPQLVRFVGKQHLNVAFLHVYTQSTIWRFNSASKRLTPYWVNSDNSTAALHVFYDSKRNGFGTTGDIQAFEGLYYPVRECYLTFNAL